MPTTDALRSIDVRRWQRCGYFACPGVFRWRWTSEGEEVASIVVQTHGHGMTLAFRTRAYDEDEWTPATTVSRGYARTSGGEWSSNVG